MMTEDRGDRIRPDESRTDPRANVFLMAVLSTPGGSHPVRVRNLSSHGALLEADDLPAEGTAAVVRRGSLEVAGEIAWSSDHHCGIRFDRAIRVGEWIERAGPAGQQRIDAAVAEFRKAPSAPSKFVILEGEVPRAGSLGRITAEMMKLTERMAGMPDMSIEIAEELLKIEAAVRRIDMHAARS